jgi:type IV secretory pathway VirB6-like protein
MFWDYINMLILKIIFKKYKTYFKNQPQSRRKTNACLEFLMGMFGNAAAAAFPKNLIWFVCFGSFW